eukprot:1587061-Pyramimonas_sp.AAC.1
MKINITSFYGSSCANNSKDKNNTILYTSVRLEYGLWDGMCRNRSKRFLPLYCSSPPLAKLLTHKTLKRLALFAML